MSVKVLAVGISFLIFILVIELTRREKLTFKYAFGWLIISLLSITLIIFDHVLFGVAGFFGFELASNFIFFAILTVFVLFSLLLTLFLCQQNKRNDAMAQKIALLEFEIKKEKEKK